MTPVPLIIVDASSEKHFAQALDELATFGCLFARMVVISQKAFATSGKLRALFNHPVSNLLLLPRPGIVTPCETFLCFTGS